MYTCRISVVSLYITPNFSLFSLAALAYPYWFAVVLPLLSSNSL